MQSCLDSNDKGFCMFLVTIYLNICLTSLTHAKLKDFPLNFRTMRKLSDLYSGIFQTQSSG